MRDVKVGDKVESLIDHGYVEKGRVYDVIGVLNGVVTVKTSNGPFHFTSLADVSYQLVDNGESILRKGEKPITQTNGFIGSKNLPIDLDWDEYER